MFLTLFKEQPVFVPPPRQKSNFFIRNASFRSSLTSLSIDLSSALFTILKFVLKSMQELIVWCYMDVLILQIWRLQNRMLFMGDVVGRIVFTSRIDDGNSTNKIVNWRI